jgi:ubiquinone/menaquinone biosynthesis C-methylase UbiE
MANRRPIGLAIHALAIAPSDVVLELGFGPGRGIARLASLACSGQVLGLDHSAAMLAQASRYNRRAIENGRVRLQQARFDALPWPSESIDKILAANVVYFFRDDGAEIREANRVLRPGGTMAIYATDRSTMASWKFARGDTHRMFDHVELMSLIRLGGFADDEITIKFLSIGFGIAGLLAAVRKSRG